jgi:cell surface protein SprA
MGGKSLRILGLSAFLFTLLSLSGFTRNRLRPSNLFRSDETLTPLDTGEKDSLIYPFDEESGGLYLNDPSNYKEEVEYDPITDQYIVSNKIGGLDAKPPMFMTPEEYREYVRKKQAAEYWRNKTLSDEAAAAEGREPGSSLIPQIQVNSQLFEKIFGSNTIDIRPQGYAELRFGGRIQNIDNPIIPERNRTNFNFDFDQRIQMNVTGSIGSKLKINTNYDTEATFSFENQTKIGFDGEEDDIVKKVEIGNVSLPLNSSLISGAQSLFGVKGQFQFGKLTLTTVLSEQQSQSSSINIQGGATTTDFEIWGDQYEANRHFFLSHYFRDNYEQFLEDLPLISSPIQITKVEVWVTNTRQETENTRNLVAFMDLGERDTEGAYRNTNANRPGPAIFTRFFPSQPFPDNENNALAPGALEQNYPGVRDIGQVNAALNNAGFEESTEYTELANARLLRPSEFTFNSQLGYVSLSTALNQDEVLAVAFQFTAGGKTYQVGEFSNDGVSPPNNLILKMLKSTILNVKVPMWDLMMKNIYSLSAYQVNREDFQLEVLYQNDETGAPIPFFPEGILKDDRGNDQLLLRVTELDQLNVNNDGQPDGFFDYVPNVTINPQNGRIIFPVLEPFGSNLAEKLPADNHEEFVFQELYDSTRFKAQNETRLNKYLLRGQFKSASGSRIQLNAFNIPRGSVTVTAGGAALVEDVDYRVDYNAGSIQILNEGLLESGTPIKVDFENNALFNTQTRIFTGLNADYRFNDNFNLGGTMVRLTERPLTQKVNIGDEPIANTIIGVNGNYSNEAPLLTRLVDKIPFIDTKAKSNLTISGEAARLIPGSPSGIELDGEETTYLDDFESSQTTYDIKNPINWVLASVPANQPDLFPEGNESDRTSGYNRAKLAWYSIDPLFHQQDDKTPNNIKDNADLQSEQYTRQILIEEVFPNLDRSNAVAQNVNMLDLAFYPDERGPYNYDVEPTPFSAGIDADGTLNAPRTRWGGIMTDLDNTNFEEQNIEFIQFWMLDPNLNNTVDDNGQTVNRGEGGFLYFNLGSVSEDILKDGQQAIENARPLDGAVTDLNETPWGYVGKVRPPVIAFDNDANSRIIQDIGYDMLTDAEEASYSSNGDPTYLQRLENAVGIASPAYQRALNDPAADNFSYYRSEALDAAGADIAERYKDFNNPQGNSIPNEVGTSAIGSVSPNIEDVNRDQTLSKTETYYQYRISLDSRDLEVEDIGSNYITDIQERVSSTLPNNGNITARWIQFKIPIFSPDKKVGPINDFRSIRFIRSFIKGVDNPIILRFATLEFIRGEWRRYQFDLGETSDGLNIEDNDNTLFEVNAVNIEQNGGREPIPYDLPPGIQREVLFAATANRQQNEQALSLRVTNLEDGDARAVFRNLDFDMRLYKQLKMFVHAEDFLRDGRVDNLALRDEEISVFIRLGADYNLNYYEYELPLQTTEWGEDDPFKIWPEENNIELQLDALKQVKLERDRVYNASGTSITERYTSEQSRGKISVVGAPNLGNVRTILIGVRNPRKRNAASPDPGRPVNAEVWVNELRLTEFDQSGGYAANARVAAQLADFANVSLSGRMSTIGFGSLDQSVTERQQEEMMAYDLQASINLDKFFPKEYGLRIPMFYSRGEEWRNPRFNPLDPDIEFEESVANIEDEAEREALKQNVQDYTSREAINFTNVRKDRVTKPGQQPKAPMPWDIENFSASYSFNQLYRSNIGTVRNERVDHVGSLNYTYQARPKPVEPFKNVDFLDSEYLKLIKDFNFYYLPKSVSAIGTLNRSLTVMQMRNTDNFELELPETFNRNFNFNRQYTLLYDLTKTLTLDFNARMMARIDELPDTGRVYTEEERNAEIWSNIQDLGRPTNYHHTTNVNWQVPVNKLPFLDFITTQARYQADFDWTTNSLNALDEDPLDPLGKNFGNTIQNNRQIQLNNRFNFLGLYNRIPYLKKVNQGKRKQRPGGRGRGGLRPGTDNAPGEDGEDKEEDEEETTLQKILAGTAKTLMMVKDGSVNYSRSQGTILPGFIPSPSIIGLDNSAGYAPGPAFVFGDQSDIRGQAVENGWLTRSALLPNQYTNTFTETVNARASIEPVGGFRITVTANLNNTSNLQEFFRFDTLAADGAGAFVSQNPFATETFNMSFLTIATAFDGPTSDAAPNSSRAYQQFLDNRIEVSDALSQIYADTVTRFNYDRALIEQGDSTHYRYFGLTSQSVMIPAFLAAYTGQDINGYNLDFKRSVPLPNWNITYDGLSKIKAIKKLFSSVVLTHNYRSTYTVSNITSNLLRIQQQQDFPDRAPVDNSGNLLPERLVGAVVLSEQFAPLIGFNVKLKNSMNIRLEYKKDRNITLSLANAQVTETRGFEWVIGTGYIIKNVKLKFIRLGKQRTNPVSNLELKLDLGIRDNATVIRRISEGTETTTAGQRIINGKFSADYQMSKRVNTKLFYDLNLSTFKTSNAYPISTHLFGISLRLNLGA